MASRAWQLSGDDSLVYDANRVQLAYHRINSQKRQPLFPSVENWQRKFEQRARHIQDEISNPRLVVPDYHRTLAGRTANDKHNGGTFALAQGRTNSGPSLYDDPGIAMVVLPDNKHNISGGRIAMHRPPNNIERHILRTASMPGPSHYNNTTDWHALKKPGPKMVLPKHSSKLQHSDSAPLVRVEHTNMTYDHAVRPRLLGPALSLTTRFPTKLGLHTTPGPSEYKQHIPTQLKDRVKGGTFLEHIQSTAEVFPAPHDYQQPSNRTKGLTHGFINPPATNANSSTAGTVDGQNWWERGRGPGKYVVKDTLFQPAAKLVSIHPYPTAAENAYHRARDRGIELSQPVPGPSNYSLNLSRFQPEIKGLGFGRVTSQRTFGETTGDKNDVPYLNPPLPGTTSIHEGSGNRIGFSLGSRTALGVDLEAKKRGTEPSAQTYDAVNSETLVYARAPAFTMAAKPYEEEFGGALAGPGAATYEPSAFSQQLMGAARISTRGSYFSTRYTKRAAGIGMPLSSLSDPGNIYVDKKFIPGPGTYPLPDPIGESALPGALIDREMDPNADLKRLFEKTDDSYYHPISPEPKVGRRGNRNSVGGRVNKYQQEKRKAIVRRARLAMLKARRSGGATWNG